jgi:hypothetical protein
LENPSDEDLVNLVSRAIRQTQPNHRAHDLLEVANMCMTMADRTLGSQVPVAKCLVLQTH